MATVPSPGTLRVIRGTPNPNGAQDARLFLFVGDATQPIRAIFPNDGVTLPARPTRLDIHPFHLRALHWNDLHACISRVTSRDAKPIFSRFVSHIRKCREATHNDPHASVIVLSAGDDMIGTPFDELMADARDPIHAAYRLYSLAGVDMGALGNHEFDIGTRALADTIRRDARFPLLCANLTDSHSLGGTVFPAALLVTKGVRVGVIGLTTAAEIIHRDDPDFRIVHPVPVAQNLIAALRPLCDVFIVLSHLGRDLAATTAVMRDAGDVELAQGLSTGSASLIIGGHTHTALNESGWADSNIVHDIPIVQAGTYGSHLGQVDITLNPRVTVTRARLIAMNDLPVDEVFERDHVQPLVARVQSLLTERLGRISRECALGTEPPAVEFALANFIADAMVAGCRAAGYAVDLAMIDTSSQGCELGADNELTFEDCFNLMPHADIIRVCEITVPQLLELLDDNARRVDRPNEPSEDRCFLQFSRELRYAIKLGDDRRDARAIDIHMDNVTLDAQRSRLFRVACTSFTRQSCSAWETRARQLGMPVFNVRELPSADTALSLRGAVLIQLREHRGITVEGGARRDGRVRIR